MAELAAGAVSSLLGVIRNEALLLRGVRDDVQFIKEEMESMNSFLAHLARRAPPGSDHDEQVRTWMNQVRLLAQDCNNCIDLYLYRGNPDIQRARGGLHRHLWWALWILQKMVAQHRAAIQLRQLKDRARDVGERRLRYGVEVPAPSAQEPSAPDAAGAASSAKATLLAADDDEDHEHHQMVATVTNHSGRRSFFCPRSLDEYVKAKLLEWVKGTPDGAIETLSIAIMAPDSDREARDLAHETLVAPNIYYRRSIMVDITAVHLDILPIRPKEVLYYVLRELELELRHPKSQSIGPSIDQSEGEEGEEEEEDEDEDGAEYGDEDEEEDFDSLQDFYKKCGIYQEKKKALHKIKKAIKEMKISEKLDAIKSEIQVRQPKGDQLQQVLQQLVHEQKKGVDKLDIHILLQLLLLQSAVFTSQQDQLKNRDIHKLPVWDDTIITKTAKKLKEHMEVNEEDKRLEEENKTRPIEEEEKEDGEDNNEDGKEEEEEEEDDEKEEEGGQEKEDEDAYEEKEVERREEEDEDNDFVEDDEDEEEDRWQTAPIHLHESQYAQILRDVFPKSSSNKPLQDHQQGRLEDEQHAKTMSTILDKEQIKQMIDEAKQEILKELHQEKPNKNQATGEPGLPGMSQGANLEKLAQKIEEIKYGIREQLKIKGLVDQIKHHLNNQCPLIILNVDEMMDGSNWEEIRKALSLLRVSADVLIFTTTNSTQQSKGFVYPPREPIDYSLVGLYYDTLLEITNQQKYEDGYNPNIFRNILEQCESNEFCMKIFTHAMHANPKRSNLELLRLHSILQDSPKSSNIIAKKVFKFSYSDLPKEYKSCLLYMAIFSPGQNIRRSTLIGRWVTEGLIFKEDWHSSVRRADQCFDVLIDRWLISPADIGATGKVKSCVVGDLVHGFITMIARKQHIVETRLSHHLARHFSIFNDLQLRSSDIIDKFFQKLSQSSRVSLLKVLDLEGCQCFGGKNQRYVNDICTKMLLLKYLSLRGTDITHLPSEINNLRELEVLDIRNTKVPAYATVNILLLKLKRLLASNIIGGPSNPDTSHSNYIPHKIDKMVNMEVLSNFKARTSHDLKDIGKLWQLRMLGVVIDDKKSHLKQLLRTISDLHECLRSLSITLPVARRGDTPPSGQLPDDIVSRLRHNPKLLQSLSVTGSTLNGCLLPLFTKDVNNTLSKVTLTSSSLNEEAFKVLAELPNLLCVRLIYIAFTESTLTFNENEFNHLKYLLVEGSNLTNIVFKKGASRELEKMVLRFTSIMSISGVGMLPQFEELELNGSHGRLLSSFEGAKTIAKLKLSASFLQQGDLQILAKKPNLQCLELLDMSCDESQITFDKGEFPKLQLLTVNCSSITKIVFTSGSVPKLEKVIIWSFTSLSGIESLSRLKELEFNGIFVPDEVKEAIKKHKKHPILKHKEPKIQSQAKGEDQEDDDDAARFLFCWKKQV